MGDNNGEPPKGDQGTPPEGGDKTLTLTQSKLDELIKERLERDRRARDEKYSDYEDYKKAAAELKTLKEAQLSDQEKQQKRIAELEQAQADFERRAKAQEMEVNEKLICAEVRVQAAAMGFTSPDDAYRLADLADVTVGEDGSIKGIDKALKKLAGEKAYLLASERGPGSPANRPKKKGDETDWVQEARQRYGIKDYGKSE